MPNPTPLRRPSIVFLFLGLVACTTTASAGPIDPPPATPSDATDPRVDIGAVEAAIGQALTVTSPTERTLTPRGAQLLGAHGPSLVTTFRHISEKQDGATVGVRLFGIRRGSLAAKFGLENADRVESILGKPLDTPEHITAAFEAVKSATSFDITLSRRGAPLRIVTTVK